MKIIYSIFIITLATTLLKAQHTGGVILRKSTPPLPLFKFPSPPKNIDDKGISLQTFCPTPQDQGTTNSCVGWAIAYSMMTIQRVIKDSLTRQKDINRTAYSAYYLLSRLKDTLDCEGIAWDSAFFAKLQNINVCRSQVFDNDNLNCGKTPPDIAHEDARYTRITNIRRVFDDQKDIYTRIDCMFESLRQKHPILILCKPQQGQTQQHVKVVIGYKKTANFYDFEIMDSNGAGFYDRPCTTIVDELENDPNAALIFDVEDLENTAGTVKIERNSNLYVAYNYNIERRLYETISDHWKFQDQFELILKDIPVQKYIYILSFYDDNRVDVDYFAQLSDNTHKNSTYDLRLPQNKELDYSIPQTDLVICILYANQPIKSFNAAVERMKQSVKKNCIEQLKNGFGEQLRLNSVNYAPNKVAYHVEEANNPDAIVPVIIELKAKK